MNILEVANCCVYVPPRSVRHRPGGAARAPAVDHYRLALVRRNSIAAPRLRGDVFAYSKLMD
jgi:hypothetical protein